MTKETLDDQLKREMKDEGRRWNKQYVCLSIATKREWIRKMKERRLLRERHAADVASRDTSDEDAEIRVSEAGTSVFSHGTGGGRRVIRGTDSLS